MVQWIIFIPLDLSTYHKLGVRFCLHISEDFYQFFTSQKCNAQNTFQVNFVAYKLRSVDGKKMYLFIAWILLSKGKPPWENSASLQGGGSKETLHETSVEQMVGMKEKIYPSFYFT